MAEFYTGCVFWQIITKEEAKNINAITGGC